MKTAIDVGGGDGTGVGLGDGVGVGEEIGDGEGLGVATGDGCGLALAVPPNGLHAARRRSTSRAAEMGSQGRMGASLATGP
jgi:hypothetical protein